MRLQERLQTRWGYRRRSRQSQQLAPPPPPCRHRCPLLPPVPACRVLIKPCRRSVKRPARQSRLGWAAAAMPPAVELSPLAALPAGMRPALLLIDMQARPAADPARPCPSTYDPTMRCASLQQHPARSTANPGRSTFGRGWRSASWAASTRWRTRAGRRGCRSYSRRCAGGAALLRAAVMLRGASSCMFCTTPCLPPPRSAARPPGQRPAGPQPQRARRLVGRGRQHTVGACACVC